MRKIIFIGISIITFLFLTSCQTAECIKDSDCIVVTDGCCSCNSGGKNKAILLAEKESYGIFQEKKCSNVMCLSVISDDKSCDMKAVCNAGKCLLN